MSQKNVMSPSQVADELRRIAAGIERSKNPVRQKVAQRLRQLFASIGPLWVTVLPAERKALVFQTKEEAGASAVENEGALVSEAGTVGVVVYTEEYDVIAEPADELPIMGTEEVGELAKGISDTTWYDTRTAVPGDTLEPFAETSPPPPEAVNPAPSEPADGEDSPKDEEDEEDEEDDGAEYGG
jgi:hypothetical protein